MTIDLTPHRPAKRKTGRMFVCMFRQKSKTRACPEFPRLDEKTVLVTGGGAGVGEFVSRGLLARGANVVSLSRGVSRGTGNVTEIESIKCDLAEGASIVSAVEQLGTRKFDAVICNSGILMSEHQENAAGVEKTCAVNVFGHHLLYRLLIERGMLADNARIVMTSGDIYVMAKECVLTPQAFKKGDAYAGSKLGNLWQVFEIKKRYPNIRAYAVHPGVVLSGFGGGSSNAFARWMTGKLFISKEKGAQAALIAATQDLPNGSYWHNVVGLVDLPPTDISTDSQRAAALWDELESLASPWLKGGA